MIDLKAIKARLEAATEGPWEYGGMIGDPGEPLRHFVQNKAGKIILLSEVFAVDYASLGKDLILSAHAPTDIKALLDRVEELEARLVKIELKKEHWRAAAVQVFQSVDDLGRRAEFDEGLSDIEYLLDEEDQNAQALAAGEDQPTTGKEE